MSPTDQRARDVLNRFQFVVSEPLFYCRTNLFAENVDLEQQGATRLDAMDEPGLAARSSDPTVAKNLSEL